MKKTIIASTVCSVLILTSCSGGGGSGSGAGSSNPHAPRKTSYTIHPQNGVTCHNPSSEKESDQAAISTKSCIWNCATDYDRKKVTLYFKRSKIGVVRTWRLAAIWKSKGRCS